MKRWEYKNKQGFTIVELLIVVVVIAILAAITIVAYNGIQNRAKVSALVSELSNASKQLKIDHTLKGAYPESIAAANNGQGIKASNGTYFRYSANNTASPNTFCLTAVGSSVAYSVTEQSGPTEGGCINVALGASSPNSRLTDGVTTTDPYFSLTAGLQSVTVDLGSVQDVSSVKVWHYYYDARSYNSTKVEVSEDNTNWRTVFDSGSAGVYPETSAGKTISFSMQKVRYIRDWLNGSTSNTGNHWVEIQAF